MSRLSWGSDGATSDELCLNCHNEEERAEAYLEGLHVENGAGRPDRFWHPIIYWNVHSVLWEITIPVFLYSTVLIIEFIPMVLETDYFKYKPRARAFGHMLHKLTPVMAVVGMALSMLHQSSLGATYGVLSGRAIWFKPSIPVMFILSAIAGGVAGTLLITMIVSQLYNRQICDIVLHPRAGSDGGDVALASDHAVLALVLVCEDFLRRDCTVGNFTESAVS